MKMSKSVTGWMLHLKAGHYSTCTIDNYRQIISRVIKFLEDPEPADITIWDLEGYLAALRDTGVSESTRQTHWKVIKSYFAWASLKKGLSLPRPDTELEMPFVPDPEIQPYTKDEIKRLLAACKATGEAETEKRESWHYKRPTADRDRMLILILLDTGIRVSELCRIRFSDIDPDNQAIHIRAFETGRKSRDRTVYVGTSVMETLWKWCCAAESPETYIFASGNSAKNTPLNRNAVDHLLKRLGKKAGVPHCGAHRFRHTFAIEYLRNGGDIYTLKRLIGHHSFYMVQRYLQLSESDAAAAHRKASPVDNWM